MVQAQFLGHWQPLLDPAEGRPGWLVSEMGLVLPWSHLCTRWPLLQDSQAYVLPLMCCIAGISFLYDAFSFLTLPSSTRGALLEGLGAVFGVDEEGSRIAATESAVSRCVAGMIMISVAARGKGLIWGVKER